MFLYYAKWLYLFSISIYQIITNLAAKSYGRLLFHGYVGQNSRHKVAGFSAQNHPRPKSRYRPDCIFIWSSESSPNLFRLLAEDGVISCNRRNDVPIFLLAVKSAGHSHLLGGTSVSNNRARIVYLTTMTAALQFVDFQLFICVHAYVCVGVPYTHTYICNTHICVSLQKYDQSVHHGHFVCQWKHRGIFNDYILFHGMVTLWLIISFIVRYLSYFTFSILQYSWNWHIYCTYSLIHSYRIDFKAFKCQIYYCS